MTTDSRLVSQVVAAGLCVALAVFGVRASAAGAQAAGGVAFADWTAVGNNVATGTLLGHEVTFSGTVVDDPPSSTVDGSSNLFSESMFTPPIALGDHLSFRVSAPSSSYTLDLGSPTTDPIIDLGSDGSTLTFPAGTSITRVSGDAGLTVTGNVVTGAGNLAVDPVGLNDSNGTIQLDGTFQTISFTATTDYPLDGVYIQVGAQAPVLTPPPTPSPPATPSPPVARLSVAPNPTCVDVATTLDASASTGDRPIVRYGFEYHERDANGHPDPTAILLADSSSPKATARFPWSREESAATWGKQQVSIWVRDPAVVTLTVTDTSGATGTTTATVNFADSTSNGDEFACAHIGTPPPAPSVPVQVSSGSTDAQARSLFAAASCRLAGVACTGDIIGGTPSLADEGRRLLVEHKIEQLKERIEELRRDIADALASERSLADQAAATDDQSERTLLIVLAKIAHKGAQEDEELLDKDITELNALDHKDRALVHQLSSKVRPARAAPATPQFDVVAVIPFRIAAGTGAAVNGNLSAGATQLLRRYGRLHLTLYTYTLTATGKRTVTSRAVTIHVPKAH